jgi:NADPH2:quinone reductase
MKAIRVRATGGPEVMSLEDVESPDPPPGHVRVRVEAAGVNFIDVYHRTGLYPLPLPFTPGLEGAGVVDAVGAGVSSLDAGTRVAFANVQGAYAEQVVAPADRLVAVPGGVETRTAAAAMLQGMTAHYLVHTTYALEPGKTCLVHAAAGGVGLLLVQMAKRRGARVFGTVSNEEKARIALEAGADEVVLYTSRDFVAEVKRATGGKGVDVVYDSVGQATFAGSLDCLAPLGTFVLFGQSSGPVPPFNPSQLASKGSLFLTRPTLFHYVADRPSLERRASDVLGWIADGSLKLRIHATYPLARAADAHRALEGRLTTGKLLLVP